MRIERIHVDGFGILHDMTVGSLSPGLSVVHGSNEAGKTTLLAFIRAILFGFPDGRSNENAYQPLRGGSHGGSITLANGDLRPYLIERRRGPRGGIAKITLPDGSLGDESTLRQLLGNATRDLFRNIFAFSLSELQQFESLGDEAVRSTIYSAGLGAGRLSLPAVERELDGLQGQLYRPRGTTSTVQALLKELQELRRQLAEIGGRVQEYDEAREKLAECESLIQALKMEEQQASQQRESADRLLRAWDDWIALCRAEKERTALPIIDSFPEDGLTLLQEVETALVQMRETMTRTEIALAETREKRDAIQVNHVILELSDAIGELQRGRDRHQQQLQELPVLMERRQAAEARVDAGLRDLGPAWDRERIWSFDTSISVRDVIRDQQDLLNRAESRVNACASTVEQAQRAVDAATRAKGQAAAALQAMTTPEEQSLDALAQRRQATENVAALVRQRASTNQTIDQLAEREKDLQAEMPFDNPASPISLNPTWWLLAAALIGLWLGAIAWMLGGWALGLPTAILSGGVVCAAYLVVRHKLPNLTSPVTIRNEEYLAGLRRRRDQIAAERATAITRLKDIEDKIAGQCAALGIETPRDEDQAENLIRQLDAARDVLQMWKAAVAADERAATALAEAQRELARCGEEFALAERARDEARDKWAHWLSSIGLDPRSTPAGALDSISAVKECRERCQTSDELRAHIEQTRAHIDAYREGVATVAQDCGERMGTEDNATVAVMDHLATRLRTAQENSRKRAEFEGGFANYQKEIDLLERRLGEAAQQRDEILARGGAPDVFAFRERAAQWERHKALGVEISAHNAALERIAGRGPLLAAFKTELSPMDPVEQESIRTGAENALEEIAQRLEATIHQRGSCAERVRGLETEDRAGQLRLQEQALLTRLREAARQWSVLALTRAVLAEARGRYERDRQPAVIRDAASFFGKITGDEYTQVIALPEEAALEAVDRTGHRKQTRELSRGTQEQLYFAVRLGLIRELSRRQCTLPVVMDDTFVNFDAARAEASLRAVLELVETHQVLLFTCHPETCQMVGALSPETPIYHLNDGAIQPFPAK